MNYLGIIIQKGYKSEREFSVWIDWLKWRHRQLWHWTHIKIVRKSIDLCLIDYFNWVKRVYAYYEYLVRIREFLIGFFFVIIEYLQERSRHKSFM